MCTTLRELGACIALCVSRVPTDPPCPAHMGRTEAPSLMGTMEAPTAPHSHWSPSLTGILAMLVQRVQGALRRQLER